MLWQLKMTADGQIKDKVQIAIDRLKAFEPEEGYYVAFSGGKDSQCVYHLCKMAGVKFDAHYAITSVDPPELVHFIKTHYPDVEMAAQHYTDGKPEHLYSDGRPRAITMWNLIADHTIPPTRKSRYCCAALKEPGGAGRIVVTGVRWAESINRRMTHDVVSMHGKPKSTQKMADEMGVEYRLNKHGSIIMNDDNDEARRMVEQCYRTRKTMVNPIVDWEEEDVWNFLNGNGIEHCCLYDEGFSRLGCIGCPLSGSRNMIKDFERWPKYKELYIKAFAKMIERHPGEIKVLDPTQDTKFKLDFDGIEGGVASGSNIGYNTADGCDPSTVSRTNRGGTTSPGAHQMVDVNVLRGAARSSGSSGGRPSDNRARRPYELVFERWLEMGAT